MKKSLIKRTLMKRTLTWLGIMAITITSTIPIHCEVGNGLENNEYAIEKAEDEKSEGIIEDIDDIMVKDSENITTESIEKEIVEENLTNEITEEIFGETTTELTESTEITKETVENDITEENTTEENVGIILHNDIQVASESDAEPEKPDIAFEFTVTSYDDWISMKSNNNLFSEDMYIGSETLTINVECDIDSSFTQIIGSETSNIVINGNNHIFDTSRISSNVTYNNCKIGDVVFDNGYTYNINNCVMTGTVDLENDTVAVFSGVSFEGIITVENTSGLVTLNSCTFDDIADTGMNIKQQGNYVVINNTSFSGTGVGILIGQGTNIALNNCSFNGLAYGMRNDMSVSISYNTPQGIIEFNDCTSDGCDKVYYIENWQGDILHVNGGTYTGTENGSSEGFVYTIGNSNASKGYYHMEIYDAFFENFDVCLKTGYTSHLVSDCVFENNRIAVKTNDSGGNGYYTIEDCKITGRSNSDITCFGVDISGGNGNIFSSTEESNYGYVIKNTSISNCYNAINMHHSMAVYVDNVTATNVNSGINSGEGSRANGMAFVCNSHFTARKDKNDYSHGVAVSNSGAAGYNNTFDGFHIGVSNVVGGFSSGHMCWINTDILNVDIGADIYVSALVGCHITAKSYGVRCTASNSIYNSKLEGIGEEAKVGISGLTSYGNTASYSELLLGVSYIEGGYPSTSNLNGIGKLQNIIQDSELSDKSEICNFKIGVSADGTSAIFYTNIHDCEIGIQTDKWEDNETHRGGGQVQYKDTNEIYNCLIGVNNGQGGFYIYPISFDKKEVNTIHDCEVGFYNNGWLTGSSTVLEDKYILGIYNCNDTGFKHNKGSLYFNSVNLYDNTKGCVLLNNSELSFQGGFSITDNTIGIIVEDGSTLNIRGATRVENNEDNMNIEGKVVVYYYGKDFGMSKDNTYMDNDSYLEIGYGPLPTSDSDFSEMFFMTEDDGYYEGKIIILSTPRAAEFDENIYNYFKTITSTLGVEVKKEGWIAEAVMQPVNGTDTPTIALTEGIYVTYDYKTNGGTSWSGTQNKVAVRKGSEVDISHTAIKDGYEFVGWNTDKNSKIGLTAENALTAIDDLPEDITLYAIYKKDMSIVYNDCDGIMATDTVEFYNNDTTMEYELLEYSGNRDYEFVGYTLDADDIENLLNNTIDLTPSDTLMVYSVYRANGKLQYNSALGILENTDTYIRLYVGSNIKDVTYSYILKDHTPRPGYKFVGWENSAIDILFKVGDVFNTSNVLDILSAIESQIMVTSIAVSPKESIIYCDEDVQLSVNVLPEDALDKSVSWTSSDENIATVDKNGLVSGVNEGVVTITVKTNDGSNLSDTAEIKVVKVKSEKPIINVSKDYIGTVEPGKVTYDEVDKLWVRINEGEWFEYTEPMKLYGKFKIEAYQTTKRGVVSEIAEYNGVELASGITAEYIGEDKPIGEEVPKSEIVVTVHYPNSPDKIVTDFNLEDYVIKQVGDNTVIVIYQEYEDSEELKTSVIVVGYKDEPTTEMIYPSIPPVTTEQFIEEKVETPKTGDDIPINVVEILLAVSGGLLALAVYGKNCKFKGKKQ